VPSRHRRSHPRGTTACPRPLYDHLGALYEQLEREAADQGVSLSVLVALLAGGIGFKLDDN
jgi:hypothetical protein